MNTYKKLFILFALLATNTTNWLVAQKTLTKQEAVKTALENNFGIKVSNNSVRVAQNNATRENNDYLPTLNASAGPNATFGSSKQNFSNGLEAKTQNAFSWTASASLNANYTIFDKSRDYTVEQLKEAINLSDLQRRQTIEGVLLQLYSAYYQVAQLSQNLDLVSQSLEVSRRRLERAQNRYAYGQGVRVEVLNAQVDIQRDSVGILNIRQQLANAKRNLNVVMGAPVDNAFQIDTTVHFITGLLPEQLVQQAKTNNLGILLTDKNRALSEWDLKINDAGRKPTIGAAAGYSLSYQDNASGSFFESSTNSGLNLGVTLNWNILDGGRRKIREQNTRIAIENNLIQKQQIEQELERDVHNAWEIFQNALFVLEVEKNGLNVSRLNLQRTEELFNAGQVNSVEFRQAQLNLLNSTTGYTNAKFSAKLAELQLLQLSGRLLEEVEGGR